MSEYIIGNPVPTPEEMAEILGLSMDRVHAIRRIMSAPAQQPRRSAVAGKGSQKAAAKKAAPRPKK